MTGFSSIRIEIESGDRPSLIWLLNLSFIFSAKAAGTVRLLLLPKRILKVFSRITTTAERFDLKSMAARDSAGSLGKIMLVGYSISTRLSGRDIVCICRYHSMDFMIEYPDYDL